jgi:manganese/iron transport system substrate-binding protein
MISHGSRKFDGQWLLLMATTGFLVLGQDICRKPWKIVSFLLFPLMVSSCSNAPSLPFRESMSSPVATTKDNQGAASSKKLLVVVTTDVLCSLVKTVAKETVNLKCLIAAGTDPHTYTVTPTDRQTIETANLLLYAGYDFEPTIIKVIEASKNTATKVAVNEVAVTKPLQMVEDGKTETDPHVWHDAQNGIKMVKSIEAALSKAVPARAKTYADNAKSLTTELTQLDSWIKTQIATIPAQSRKLVTTHDALGYYGKAYSISIEGVLQGLSTEEKPTPTRVKKLVTDIKSSGVSTIFAESTASSKLLETVANEAKVKISTTPLFADGLGETGSAGDTYLKMLVSNTKVITEGLGGKFEPFVAK